MTKLFTPPTWDHFGIIEGNLTFHVTTCYAVWRIGGVWGTAKTPGMSNPDVRTVDIDAGQAALNPGGGQLWFTTPTVVTDTIAADITAHFNPTLPASDHQYTLT